MQQAAVLDGLLLDRFSPFKNGLTASGVVVGWCQIADALVVSAVIVVVDEAADLACIGWVDQRLVARTIPRPWTSSLSDCSTAGRSES